MKHLCLKLLRNWLPLKCLPTWIPITSSLPVNLVSVRATQLSPSSSTFFQTFMVPWTRPQLTLLALFDVSAAFDSVENDILLRRLSITFGINELPLAWITSYLSERSASVLFHSSRSRWRPTPFGLPQQSVLGPLLYILFTADIGPLLASCSLASHSYADDVQAYKHCLASR